MVMGHQPVLHQLTLSALAAADLPTLMLEAASVVAQTLAVEHCAIWELHSDCRTLEFRAGIGWTSTTAGHARVDECIPSLNIGDLLQSRVMSLDWRNATTITPPPGMRNHGVIGSLYILLPGQPKPFGILEIDVATPRTFSADDHHFLHSVANLLALAIAHIRARHELAQQVLELTAENARLGVVAHHTAVREERQRLARDLHDSVTQALYSVTLHARAATRLLTAGDVAGTAENLHLLQDTAQEVLDEMRLLIFDLRPPLLEQVGLAAALQARLNAVEGRAHLATQLIVDQVSKLPPYVEEALYRIAQEALNNALKHAQAHHILVHLHQLPSGLSLEISDDGVGFDVAAARDAGGFGLCGIAERVSQLGGKYALHSAPGNGTHLRVEIAL